MAFRFNIVGLKELQAKFDKLPDNLKKEAAGIIENGAKVWVRNAKRDAPIDLGKLKQGISYFNSSTAGNISFTIVSNQEYSPYLEWGTITKVDVPAELSAYAIQFKGKGIRKTGGIIPRPFFFKQGLIVKPMIEKGIKSILDEVKV